MRRPSVRQIATVVVLSAVMLFFGAIAGGVGRTESDTAAPSGVVAPVAQAIRGADATKSAAALQERLRTVPDDWSAWSQLGALYTSQARLTADPSYYSKADGAFTTSLRLHPQDNLEAITGQATLAASRHAFGEALQLTESVDRKNPYAAGNLAIMVDALVELGRYPEAFIALQRMVDLKPGVASYARVSYSYELRGDNAGAKFALEHALAVAQSPSDASFAQQYLGELAFNSGDLTTAGQHFAAGLERDPSYVPLLAGRARVEAAQGRTSEAITDWQDVTSRLPQPTYLIEYADLLTSLNRTEEAAVQYSLIEATAKLFRAQGANVDLELSLFDADNGRAPQALSAAQAQIDQRNSLHVEDAYAWALHASGRDAEALTHAVAADRLGMKNALFAYHRGMIEKSLGRDAEAVASLEKALTINPYFSPVQAPLAKAALAQLQKKAP